MNNLNNYGTQHTIDTAAVTKSAKAMDIATLKWSANDAHEAATAADELERAGCHVSKSGGFYRDEATIYRIELGRRFSALADGDELTVGQEVLVRFFENSHASIEKVTSIDFNGKAVRHIKKKCACRDGVIFMLEGGRWAHGYQVAARQSAEEIDALRQANRLG